MSNIAFIDLAEQQKRISTKINMRIDTVLSHGKYILGPEVDELEQKLAQFSNVKHAISCGNGTDALLLALMALNVKAGDVIFCPSFTFAATAEVVPMLGAIPFFVDVDEKTFNISSVSLTQAIEFAKHSGLTPKGIIAVDLFGLPADYDNLEAIATQNDLFIIADSAQGYGATYNNAVTGSIGDVATTSFFPAKPLGCYGDGGAIFTDDDKIASEIKSLRFHGKGKDKYDNEKIGMNSRLDTIQAAILLAKIDIYSDEINLRNLVADRYLKGINNKDLRKPYVPSNSKSVWAQFTLVARSLSHRENIMQAMAAKNIPAVIYYPKPLHLQTAYKSYPLSPNGLAVSERLATQVFSIPMHPYLEKDTQDFIIDVINAA